MLLMKVYTRITMDKYKKYLIDGNLLIYAFRYALKRHSYAVSDVVEAIKSLWNDLPVNHKKLIKKEIELQLDLVKLGVEKEFEKIDSDMWREILKLGE